MDRFLYSFHLSSQLCVALFFVPQLSEVLLVDCSVLAVPSCCLEINVDSVAPIDIDSTMDGQLLVISLSSCSSYGPLMLSDEGGVSERGRSWGCCSSSGEGGISLVSPVCTSKELSEDTLHDEVAVLREYAPATPLKGGEWLETHCVSIVEAVDEDDSVSAVQTELHE